MRTEYNTDRFIKAQEFMYTHALNELKCGKKRSHWMWFIFPQLKALGRSSNALYYGIEDLDEARAYLSHPILGERLRNLCSILLSLETNDPFEVMGYPDNLKLCSSMTLFAMATDDNALFVGVIEKYFSGIFDAVTIDILSKKGKLNNG